MQDVWVRLLDDDRAVLRNFQGSEDASLIYYLIAVARTTVMNKTKRSERRIGSRVTYSWEDLPPAARENARRTDGQNLRLERRLWAVEVEQILRQHGRQETLGRDLTILHLWLEGHSLAEITRITGLSFSKPAIAKIIARQCQIIREAIVTLKRQEGVAVPLVYRVGEL